jgi:hypothetical protein
MEDVIARLRESKQKQTEQEYQDGFEMGQEWARWNAEARELGNLQAVKAGGNWDRAFVDTKTPGQNSLHAFIDAIDPEIPDGGFSVAEFWLEHVVDSVLNANVVRGFADGSLAVWDEVKALI